MSPDLSRRLGLALGTHDVDPADRDTIVDAAEQVEEWDDLPAPVRHLVLRIEAEPASWATNTGP